MKKLFLFIAGLFVFSFTSAYDVIIYDNNNNLLFMYPVEEGTTEITLEGDRTKNGNNYTFNGGFTGLNVYYYDGYGNYTNVRTDQDLYINGEYSLGYTGEQYLQLNENSCGVFTGYKPVFDVTGNINTDTGNIFNNFTDNALTVLLSNIPSYIQRITLFAVLMLILGFVRKFKRH